LTDDAGQDRSRAQLNFSYATYRAASFDRKYYGQQLSHYQKYNFLMEIAIAIGAAGSGGLAGLAVWGTITGKYAWLAISGVATLLSVVKPILQLGKQIEKYTKLYIGYTTIYLELKDIVEDIKKSRSISKKSEASYDVVRKLNKELGGLGDPRRDAALIRRLQAEVNTEITSESLWLP
jgi:hypothetical protein